MSIRLIILGIGIFLLCADALTFFMRRLTPMVALIWLLSAGVMLLFAIIPFWGPWLSRVDPILPFPIVVLILLVIFGLFWTSVGVSRLIDRNRELTMQIALLNQENELIIEILREMGKEL